MMHHQHVEKNHWAEAVNTSVYLINRTLCAAWSNKTPFELCYGKQPNLSHLKVFGSKGYAHVDKSKRKKLDDKTFPCVFLGYAMTSKGYRVWDLVSQKLVIVRSASFDERSPDAYVRVVDGPRDNHVSSNCDDSDCGEDDHDPHDGPDDKHTNDGVMSDGAMSDSSHHSSIESDPYFVTLMMQRWEPISRRMVRRTQSAPTSCPGEN
jgi:hypothetical protein